MWLFHELQPQQGSIEHSESVREEKATIQKKYVTSRTIGPVKASKGSKYVVC